MMGGCVRGGHVLVALLAALFSRPALAQLQESPETVLKSLRFEHGHIDLAGGIAALNLSSDFAYLDPHEAQTFLTKVWHNPPGAAAGILGMILPNNVDQLGADGWGVVLIYDNSGHVSDDDAASIDYAKLLDEMKQQTVEANKTRAKDGYEPIELLGWARPPHYNKETKTIFWAKRLRFGTDSVETLNYLIRVLGRTGVFEMNVVDTMDHFARVDAEAGQLMAMLSFQKGSTYDEFDPKIDEKAAYGIAGLVAGGILAKAGFFKGLIALIIAFKKVIAVAVVGGFAAAWGTIRRLFGRSRST